MMMMMMIVKKYHKFRFGPKSDDRPCIWNGLMTYWPAVFVTTKFSVHTAGHDLLTVLPFFVTTLLLRL